jgi:hypothetical protein
VRSPVKEKNSVIRIVVIECPSEKAAGRQYTKRMLPSFLTSYCVIRQDIALEAFMKFENNASLTLSDREEIATMLGCIDLRTVNRHMQAIADKLRSTQSEMCRFLSSQGNTFPYLRPGVSLSDLTVTLINQLNECFASGWGKIIPTWFFSVIHLISHLNHYSYFSMTYASRNKDFWDTS